MRTLRCWLSSVLGGWAIDVLPAKERRVTLAALRVGTSWLRRINKSRRSRAAGIEVIEVRDE